MASPQQALQNALRQVGQMTRSQQIAILLGALLVGGSVAWLVQWAARPEMAPLLPQALSPDELAQVTGGLDALDEYYRIEGGQVLVPRAANRSAIIAALHQSDRMPADTSTGFAELVKDANPWLSQAENNRRWTLALQEKLESVLRGFEGVRDASVFLNLNAQKQGFSRYQPESSASVQLTMQGGAPAPRSLALSAARLVSGAVRGLPLRNVQVTDSTGASSFDFGEDGDGVLAGIARERRAEELRRTASIRQQLDYITGLKVNVQVVLSHTSQLRASEEYSEGAATETLTTEQETRRRARLGQPGVQPNTGEAVASGAEGDVTTSSTNRQSLQPSRMETSETTPAGQIQEVFASINVARGYLAEIWRRANADATEEPTDAQIDEVFAQQRERIVRQVTKLVYPPKSDQIAVDWYHDGVGVEPVVEAGTLDQGLQLAQRVGAPAALLGLALLSLFVMLRMARQAPGGEAFGLELGMSADELAAARQAREDARRASGRLKEEVIEEDIPEGLDADGVMEGQEVSDEVVQINRMLEQVAQFVAQDEQGVAGVLERWLDDRE